MFHLFHLPPCGNAAAKTKTFYALNRFDIVVYDAFRPSTASDDMKSKGGSEAMKECYFPRADGEGSVLGDEWLDRDMAHGRGSTVRAL